MKLKAPKILNDVYRDLRDRHLLIPALALIAALIAVPVLLRDPVAEPPPVAAAVPHSADAAAVTAAVLVDDTVDVRDYRKRLAALKEKNPFESNFTLPGSDADPAADPSAAGETTSGGDTAPTETPATSTGSTDTGSTGTVPADTPGVDPGTGTSPPDTGETDADTEPTPPEIRFFAGRVDVTIGPLGKAKEYDNVKYLNFLPDDDAPLVAFIGLAGTGESAVFAISSDVEMGEGEGSCAPKKPAPCQFLTLEPGEQRLMKYDGKSYRLKLRNTTVVQVPDPREADADAESDAAAAGYDPSDDGSGE